MKKKSNRTQFVFYAVYLLTMATACSVLGASFKGSLVTPSTKAPEINLTDAQGNNFQLSALQGKVVLIFFGFTNCVDECPLTMAKLKQALESLGENSKNIKVVMVSTDPVRDSPQAMQDFLGKFNPDFMGLPGTKDQLTKIWNDYGVTVLDGGETHSSYIYAIDKNGKLRLTLDTDLTSEDIASDLKILLAEK
jgi:protein SCO1/2